MNCDGNTVLIDESDGICSACYRAQLAMVKSTEKNVSRSSSDSQLTSLIEHWKVTIASEVTDTVTKATLHAVVHVANEITHERAVLLSRVSQVFLTSYTEDGDSETDRNVLVLEVGEGTVKYTTRWLLNQLILHLQPHIQCRL